MPQLTPDSEGWNVVVIGHWNRAIFLPAWISGRLTDEKDIGLELLVGGGEQMFRLSFDSLALLVSKDRLQLGVAKATPELMRSALAAAHRVLSDLSHTPISGVGINMRFRCEEPDGKLIDAFRTSDLTAIGDYTERPVESTMIRRALQISGYALNFEATLNEGKVILDFNYHFPATNIAEGLAALSTDITTLRDVATVFVGRVYDAAVQNDD